MFHHQNLGRSSTSPMQTRLWTSKIVIFGFTALCRYWIFYKLKVCSNSEAKKSTGVIFQISHDYYICHGSIKGTKKSQWQHICLQHGLLSILSPLLRPIAQKKDSFQNITAHWQCTWSPRRPDRNVQQDSCYFHAAHGPRSHFDLQVSLFRKYIL